MDEIGQGAYVFLVLSEEYLHSSNCMYELFKMYQSSQQNKTLLLDKIIPLFTHGLSQYSKGKNREKIYQHWRKEHDELNTILGKRAASDCGHADLKELQMIGAFKQSISDILSWMVDVIMPRGTEGVDAAIELLSKRIDK
jgi:hypothetical protein